jgi:hypothetical protein
VDAVFDIPERAHVIDIVYEPAYSVGVNWNNDTSLATVAAVDVPPGAVVTILSSVPSTLKE